MKRRQKVLVPVLLFAASALGQVTHAPTPAPISPPPPPAESVIVDTFKTSTAQKQVNELALKGYRIRMAEAKSSNRAEWKDVVPGLPKGGLRIEATKEAVPPDTFSYRLVCCVLKLSTMQKKMDSASGEGYRLIPGGWLAVEHRVLEFRAWIT